MEGYPLFVSNTIVLKTLFNPNIKYQGRVKVQSDLTPANGSWKVIKIEYHLESKVPHGKWGSVLTCVTSDAATAV
jgi:hypothetical protein